MKGVYSEITMGECTQREEQILEMDFWIVFITHMSNLNNFNTFENLLQYYAFTMTRGYKENQRENKYLFYKHKLMEAS